MIGAEISSLERSFLYCPAETVLCALCVVGTIVTLLSRRRSPKSGDPVSVVADRREFAILCLCLLLVPITDPIVVPRYMVSGVAFCLVTLAHVVGRWKISQRLLRVSLIGVISLSVANRNGAWSPAFDVDSGDHRERDLRVRKDVQAMRQISELLTTRTDHGSVLADEGLGHVLAVPELGYVDRPLATAAANADSLILPGLLDFVALPDSLEPPVFLVTRSELAEPADLVFSTNDGSDLKLYRLVDRSKIERLLAFFKRHHNERRFAQAKEDLRIGRATYAQARLAYRARLDPSVPVSVWLQLARADLAIDQRDWMTAEEEICKIAACAPGLAELKEIRQRFQREASFSEGIGKDSGH